MGDRIFFDTDRFNVDTADQAVLQTQAQWLARYPNARVTLEGHADERGTRDYNLALGERRANAAKNYLASLGVDASRIWSGTFHAIGNRLLRLHGRALGLDPAFTVLDQADGPTSSSAISLLTDGRISDEMSSFISVLAAVFAFIMWVATIVLAILGIVRSRRPDGMPAPRVGAEPSSRAVR